MQWESAVFKGTTQLHEGLELPLYDAEIEFGLGSIST